MNTDNMENTYGNYLSECTKLLKSAWKEVSLKIGKGYTRDEEYETLDRLQKYTDSLYFKYGTNSHNRSCINHLKVRLQNARPICNQIIGESCSDLYKSMQLLLISDYKKYDIVDIGDAKRYFLEAIPLYCKLSKDSVEKETQKIIDADKASRKSNIQTELSNGNILKRLVRDIYEIKVVDIDRYKAILVDQTPRQYAIASKGNYILELVPNMYEEKGIQIDGTTRTLVMMNITTGKSLKIKSYSDIKEVLSKRR